MGCLDYVLCCFKVRFVMCALVLVGVSKTDRVIPFCCSLCLVEHQRACQSSAKIVRARGHRSVGIHGERRADRQDGQGDDVLLAREGHWLGLVLGRAGGGAQALEREVCDQVYQALRAHGRGRRSHHDGSRHPAAGALLTLSTVMKRGREHLHSPPVLVLVRLGLRLRHHESL